MKDGYINPKMEEHRQRQKEVSDKNSTKAKKRWGNDAVAMPQHMPTDMPNACNPESESNLNQESNQESESTSTSNPTLDSPVEDVDEPVSDSSTQTDTQGGSGVPVCVAWAAVDARARRG